MSLSTWDACLGVRTITKKIEKQRKFLRLFEMVVKAKCCNYIALFFYLYYKNKIKFYVRIYDEIYKKNIVCYVCQGFYSLNYIFSKTLSSLNNCSLL